MNMIYFKMIAHTDATIFDRTTQKALKEIREKYEIVETKLGYHSVEGSHEFEYQCYNLMIIYKDK